MTLKLYSGHAIPIAIEAASRTHDKNWNREREIVTRFLKFCRKSQVTALTLIQCKIFETFFIIFLNLVLFVFFFFVL